jgi:hypothetical protein
MPRHQAYALRPADDRQPTTLLAVHRWTGLLDGRSTFTVAHIIDDPLQFEVKQQTANADIIRQRFNDVVNELIARQQLVSPPRALELFEEMTGRPPADCSACGTRLIVGAIFCNARGCGQLVPSRSLRSIIAAR